MFVYSDRQPEAFTLRAGDTEFVVFLTIPPFDRLLEFYQLHGSEMSRIAESRENHLPVNLARALRDIFVDNAVDWQGVGDEHGVELPFNSTLLRKILDSNPTLYIQALSAVNSLLSREEEREKNEPTSSSSA